MKYTPLVLLLVLCVSDVMRSVQSDSTETHKLVSVQKRKEMKANMTKSMKEREDAFKAWLHDLNISLRYDRRAYIAGIIVLAVCSPLLWILSIIFCCMGAGTRRVQQKNTMSTSLLSQPESLPKTRTAAPVPIQSLAKCEMPQRPTQAFSGAKCTAVRPPMLHELPQMPKSPYDHGLQCHRNQSPLSNGLISESPGKILPPVNSSPVRMCHRPENNKAMSSVGSPPKLPPKLSPSSVQTRVNL